MRMSEVMDALPSYGLQPLLELGAAVGRDVEGGPGGAHDAYEVLVVGRGEMVELLVHALYVHLLTFLHQWGESCA